MQKIRAKSSSKTRHSGVAQLANSKAKLCYRTRRNHIIVNDEEVDEEEDCHHKLIQSSPVRKSKHQNKWKFGIIAKNKSLKTTCKRRQHKRRAKSTRNLIEKGIITRSISKKLIDKNILDFDNYFIVKNQSTSRILNDDTLKLIFQYLSLKDRFRIQRTCKQFYSVIQEMLADQLSLRIGNIADYYANCGDNRHSTLNANIEDAINKKYFYKYFYMNDITASKETLAQVLWKCPNVRCLELHNFNLDVETVKWLKWHSPNIECLRLDEIKYDLTARKWSQIGQLLGDKLIHLFIDAYGIKNDLTNLVQHLPSLEEFKLRKYELPLQLLIKRLSSNIKSISLIECEKLSPDSVKAIANNKQIARNLQKLELQVSTGNTELDIKEIFNTICTGFSRLNNLQFQSHYCPSNITEIIALSQLSALDLHFTRDCYLDLRPIECYSLLNLRSIRIHGAFFRPQMLEKIGQQFPNCRRLSLTNWAFCCGCADNQFADEYDCPDCDDRCCQALLQLENIEHLYVEFLYSSDYIKQLILKLLSFEKLNTLTLVWYPVNTSINSINFINAIIKYGISVANKRKNQLIRFQFENSVIALMDASVKIPHNLLVKSID